MGVGGSSLTTTGTSYTYDGEQPWVGGGGGVSLFEGAAAGHRSSEAVGP